MPKTLRGLLNADGSRFAIAVSRWNEFITQRLLEGAMECIQMHGGDLNNVTIVYVPGAFELPLATKRLAESGNYDAVIVLGAVIRGGTPHFNYVAGEAAF